MSTAKEVLARIAEEAARASPAVRFVETCPPGSGVRQGDVYLYALPESPPVEGNAARGTLLTDRQLAPGTTRGSRHVVEGEANLYARQGASPHQGPYVHAIQRVVVTHPEHAHVSLPPGWYETRFQVDWEQVEERADAPEVLPTWKELLSSPRAPGRVHD